MVTTGAGLAALPKKLVSKILANEYIDFTELPPAKGKARNVPQSLEGQVLVVQAADLMQVRKRIPDLAIWVQCFALYATTLLTYQPNRMSEMMAYQSIIARASAKYKWPSWVVYDQNIRQEAMNNPSQSWARLQPSPKRSLLKQFASNITSSTGTVNLEGSAASCMYAALAVVHTQLTSVRWKAASPSKARLQGDSRCTVSYSCVKLLMVIISIAELSIS